MKSSCGAGLYLSIIGNFVRKPSGNIQKAFINKAPSVYEIAVNLGLISHIVQVIFVE